MNNHQRELQRNMQRWPGVYRAFEHAVRSWWKPDWAKSERFKKFGSVEAYIAAYYRGFDKPTRNYPEGSHKIRCLADALALKDN